MRKSSSLQAMPLRFDPNEFQVGYSRVDKLPPRLSLRRHSAQPLPPPPNELEGLRRELAQVRQENEQLRREVAGWREEVRTEKKVEGYRSIIKEKMSSKVKSSRATTVCETGVFSSKEVSLLPSETTISDWYENYKLNSRLPSLQSLTAVADNFFAQYCENYSRLKTLFQCLPAEGSEPAYCRLSELLDLYRLPLLYQKSPQTLFRELSRERPGSRKEKREETCWETLSPQETLARMEKMFVRVCRSSQMLRLLRDSEPVRRFIDKMRN